VATSEFVDSEIAVIIFKVRDQAFVILHYLYYIAQTLKTRLNHAHRLPGFEPIPVPYVALMWRRLWLERCVVGGHYVSVV